MNCWLYGDLPGYCGRLRCARCGRRRAAQVTEMIVAGAVQHKPIWFVTIYYSGFAVRGAAPLDHELHQRNFRRDSDAIIKNLSMKARRTRTAPKLEYCHVVAWGTRWIFDYSADRDGWHRVHRRCHSHLLVNWLPDVRAAEVPAHPALYRCTYLERTAKSHQLVVWIEKPRSVEAVAIYTGENLLTAVGESGLPGQQRYKFSRPARSGHGGWCPTPLESPGD